MAHGIPTTDFTSPSAPVTTVATGPPAANPASATTTRRLPKQTKFQLEVALLVSTYQRPGHLRRALASIALQKHVAGKFEVVVTDDGSEDATSDVVDNFTRKVDFPVHFTTHLHEQFQLARCRNEGVRTTTAPYLLFLDGDLLLPHDFVAQHLKNRSADVTMAGDSCYFTREDSARVNDDTLRSGQFLDWIPPSEEARLIKKALRSKLYNLIRHPTKPHLKGGNIGIWRSDYERINGFDEHFVGWGLEDTDLQWRLARHGIRFRSSMGWTCTCHLWHPPSSTFVHKARGTDNEAYLRRPGRLSVCRHGLRRRVLSELRIGVVGRAADQAVADRLLSGRFAARQPRPEVEIVFTPGDGRYSRGGRSRLTRSQRAECRILVVTRLTPNVGRLARQADIVVSDEAIHSIPSRPQFPLDQFDAALESIT